MFSCNPNNIPDLLFLANSNYYHGYVFIIQVRVPHFDRVISVEQLIG